MKPESGYLKKYLRIDLGTQRTTVEEVSDKMIEDYVGGTGFGARFLHEEVPPGVEWNDPRNKMMFFSGPLGATRISGTGTFSVVTKGPMTNLAGCSQANGLFGAYLRLAGVEGFIVQGAAQKWVYIYIHDGTAEIRDASHLKGKGTFETEEILRKDLGLGFRGSVQAIGPAGENLVRFAMISGDGGHVVAHNGMGAVMGSKRLKAVVVARGKTLIPVKDKAAVERLTRELHVDASTKGSKRIFELGTGGGFSGAAVGGWLPIKNYSTAVFPEHEKLDGKYLRSHFKMKDNPCWACQLRHCKMCEVTEGPYKGFKGEEPEYEGLAAWGSVIGNSEPGGAIMLNWHNDNMGMDLNEAGWVVGWAMECYEKGVFSQKDLGGLDLKWGNVEGAKELLRRIAHREGIGDLLGEGVKKASEKTGGEAAKWAVYAQTGAAPRGHDHRGRWCELLDTCTSNTSTIEATRGGVFPERLGMPPVFDKFSPWEVAAVNAKENGWLQFLDCLGICCFCAPGRDIAVECVNAVTGWNLDLKSSTHIGRRIVNLLRVFNLRHGLNPALERPSFRYGETPKDGPVKGKAIMPYFDFMVQTYREMMGWEPETGRPLPHTLKSLGLEDLIEKY
ncbi:MAG TPA: aldehyde ferredoxin oxidoreductase C-terminal domain-containing protein [Thermodesulfobacteriota bacterium]|nr:aldehyde ferredoxin oxidoreductase C-terminal domain-containing protein [Thermodesulfobacteriota bacterium]